MAERIDGVKARLRAYLLPRQPETEAQREAFERAAEAQADWEETCGLDAVPGGVTSFSIGDFSATLSEAARCPAYTRETLSPVAWSILRGAGLIAYALPTAKRP